jgi:hypothetical protein
MRAAFPGHVTEPFEFTELVKVQREGRSRTASSSIRDAYWETSLLRAVKSAGCLQIVKVRQLLVFNFAGFGF